jgi:hypothetical protein
MIAVYRVGWRLLKLRAIMLLSLGCAAVSVWGGVYLAQTYGLQPGDGGVLAPLWQRLCWAAVVMLLSVGFAAGMWLYGRCYVARVEFDPNSKQLHLYTVGFLGSRKHVLDGEAVRPGRWHEGRFEGDIEVNAPWRSARVAGRRLPLILDGQGVVLDEKLMKTYFSR